MATQRGTWVARSGSGTRSASADSLTLVVLIAALSLSHTHLRRRYEEPIKSQKLLIELKNGRLAMLGMTGMLVGERLSALFTQ